MSVARPSCPECGGTLDLGRSTFEFRATRHLVKAHPNSQKTAELFNSTRVITLCSECRELFIAEVEYEDGEFRRESYCPECTRDTPLRRLVTEEMTFEEFWGARYRETTPTEPDEERAYRAFRALFSDENGRTGRYRDTGSSQRGDE